MEFVPTNYPSDLTDGQWEQIEEFFPQGPNSIHHKRSLINAVLYLVDNGCKWRALPHNLPPYSTVHTFYRRARICGTWEKVLDVMVERTREKAGRKPDPTYALVDSQSVKTTYASRERGIDGEKTKGKKRRIVVDTMGNLLSIVVHAANIHDTKSGILPAREAVWKYPTIERSCADARYRRLFEEAVRDGLGLGVDISEKLKPHEWENLPWRWIVERTLSWLDHSRRFAKDFEIAVDSAVAMVRISHLHTLLKRW